jgi:hypothetical protein
LADGGFTGETWERRWREAYGARVLCPPQRTHRRTWSPAVRRWFAGHRQIVETAFNALLGVFRLARDRGHSLAGILARTAAKIAAYNAAMLINRAAHRPLLAFAELIDW